MSRDLVRVRLRPDARIEDVGAAIQVAERWGVYVRRVGPDELELEGEWARVVVSAMERMPAYRRIVSTDTTEGEA